MPFSATASCKAEDWTRIFEGILKPAVEDTSLGYTCLRSKATRGNIVASIMESLRDAYVVLADLTDQNPNVFYELGVRHTIQDRTILIAQSRKFIPFDLQAYANHVYDWKTAEGITALRDKMKELLTEIDESPGRADNPVSDFLKSRAAPVLVPDPPEVTPREAADAQPLAGPGSDGLDAQRLARRVATSRDVASIRTIVRLTRSYFQETWPQRISNLTSNANPSERIKVEEIYNYSLPVIRDFSDEIVHLEEFGLAIVEADSAPGILELLRIIEDWISLSQRAWPGATRKTVTGSPAILALRLMCSWGAKAADNLMTAHLKLLLSTPLSSIEFSGQHSNLPLVDRRDLFWPEAMLDYADLGVRYLKEEPWENEGLRQMFAGNGDYLAGLAVFLFLCGLIQRARNPEAAWPLYPGFKLVDQGSAAIQSFMAKIAADRKAIKEIADCVPESPENFIATWPDRVRVLNEASLGGQYDIWSRWRPIPESLESLGRRDPGD